MPTHTPRAIRIPDDEWQAALSAAKANGTDVSTIVRRALRAYVRTHQKKGAEQ